MSRLQVYFNDYTHVIAHTPSDAHKVYCEYIGGKPNDYELENDWSVVPDGARLTITFPRTGENDYDPREKEQGEVTKACREWVRRGRGFLCSES